MLGGEARYDMLDTVREYVLERLEENGRLASARAAHAEYFAALADEARLELRGPEWLRWESRLELENDNLWSALEYARETSDPMVAVRLTGHHLIHLVHATETIGEPPRTICS